MRSGSNVALKFIPLIWNENLKKFLNSVQPSDNNIYHPLKNWHTLCVCVCVCVCTVVQFCPTLFDPMDYSLPGSSVQGIFHARILEQVAISYSMGSSQPRDQTCVPYTCSIGCWIFYYCSTKEPLTYPRPLLKLHRTWVNKVLLYITGNYIQYIVINHNEREYEKEYIDV